MTPSLLLFSYILLFIITSASSDDSAPYDYDVIIMGAGMTGISAGHVLDRAGMKILIIEAQDYVGGRTKVAKFGNYTFNVGASWIEGTCPSFDTNPEECAYNGHVPTKINPMQTLADKYNITYTDAGYDDKSVLQFIPQGSNLNINFYNQTEVDETWTKWNESQECMDQLMEEMDNEYAFAADISYETAQFKCGWKRPLSALEKTIEYIGFKFEATEEPIYTSFLGYQANSTWQEYGQYSYFITDPRGYAGITLGLASEYLNIQNVSAEPKLRYGYCCFSANRYIMYNENVSISVTIYKE